jgi:aminoglycoside 6'-N-acetyltransferase
VSTPVVVHLGSRELAGKARDGESWAAAARRVAASVTGEPVARDLSGETKHFMIDHDVTTVLRPMARGDLPLVTKWRQSAHVHRWWQSDGEPTEERVAAQYGPDIDGMTPTRMWVAEVNGRSIGFLQDYRLSDYPEYALLTPDPAAIGVDYAIGDEQWVGRGYGTRMLWAWVNRTRHRFAEASAYFSAPDHRNLASLRMLEKAGFVQGTWFDEPQADGSAVTVVGCTFDVARVLG